jgi:hypothetical protein
MANLITELMSKELGKKYSKGLKNADFKKYFDTTQKRNIWVLGYFGGGAVNVLDALVLANDYAEQCKVPLATVVIDEIQSSRRFKYFKYIYSTVEQKRCKGVEHGEVMQDVHRWLRD